MIFELLKRSAIGLAFACIGTFIALTIMYVQSIEATVSRIWPNMLGSMIMGIYFGIASLLYEIEKWSALKQTVIHASLSIIVYLPLALLVGWLPYEIVPILSNLVIFLVVYAIFWLIINWYLRRQAASLNRAIRR